MKYMRKTPVEAIQWNPDNRKEFGEFVNKYVRDYTCYEYTNGNILLCYWDFNARKHITEIPKFGWIVREGNTFKFYKDATFQKTFEEVQKGEIKGVDWEGMNKTVKEAFDSFDEAFKGFKDVFGAEPSKDTLDKIKMNAHIGGRLTNLNNNIYRYDGKTREEVKKQFYGGLKDMAGSDIRTTDIESVLDKMKELYGEKLSNDIVDVLTEAVKMYKDPFYIPVNKDVCRDNDRKWREAMAEKYRESSGKGVEFDTFESVLDEMKELHAKKDKDYGSAFHKSFEEFGPTAGVVRLNDKMERVKSLVKNGKAEVKDERLLDSLEDMACYAVMLYVELKNKDND